LAEYGLLGLIAAIIGSIGATILSYCVTRFVLDIPWNWTPGITLIGIVLTIGLVVLVGAVSSFDVLTRKPLPILRTQ
jgi:predicted lysophospholipase L1 biosynthesis ABC-type transport system permease subunit